MNNRTLEWFREIGLVTRYPNGCETEQVQRDIRTIGPTSTASPLAERPSYALPAQLTRDGDGERWVAEYGALIVSGDTPEEAFAAFDEAWTDK